MGVSMPLRELGSEGGRRQKKSQVKCDQIRGYDVLRVLRASNSEGCFINGSRAENERPGRGQSVAG